MSDEVKKEESLQGKIDFQKLKKVAQIDSDVVPCCVQDADSLEVLNIAYVNEEALRYSLENKKAAFWSTSRNELWVKGLTSGDVLELVDVRVNCELNSLVYLVRLVANAQCHTGRKSCYYRSLSDLNKFRWIQESKGNI